jgi:hypothetical protein
MEPLLPIARAAAAAGHAVAVTGDAAMLPAIAARGLVGLASSAWDGQRPPGRLPLLEPDADREDRVLRDVFAGDLAAQRADGVLAACRAWRPNALVCDEIDFGGMVAAERAGIPHATVLVVAAGSFVRPELVAAPLAAMRAAHRLPADPELTMLHRRLVISPFPPGLRDPRFPLPATAHSVRLSAPAPRRDGAATVHLTLGTVFNRESGDLFQRALAGLRELGVPVVAGVGEEMDPAALGPQPPGVRLERWVDQSELLPDCAAVVSHAGSGSVLAALAHGLPSVLLPIGADQPLNAGRCADLGAALVLDAVRATPAELAAAVSAVLATPSYRAAAERLAGELRRLPGPERAVELIEGMAGR